MTMPPIEAALPVAAQGFADGRIDVEEPPLIDPTHVAAGLFIRPLPQHSVHFGG
jgi:hypothetical protein